MKRRYDFEHMVPLTVFRARLQGEPTMNEIYLLMTDFYYQRYTTLLYLFLNKDDQDILGKDLCENHSHLLNWTRFTHDDRIYQIAYPVGGTCYVQALPELEKGTVMIGFTHLGGQSV